MSIDQLAAMVPDLVAVATCAVAAAIDVRRYRIPNWVTGAGALLGVAANVGLAWAIAGAPGFTRVALASIAGGALLFAIGSALSMMRFLGMGDVKLFAAVGLCVRWSLVLPVILYTALAGGLLALVLAARRGVRPSGLRVDAQNDERQRMPYGVAIAIGVTVAVLSRYVSALRLI